MRLVFPLALVGLALAGSTAAAQERFGPFSRGHRYTPPATLPCPPYYGVPHVPGVPGTPGVMPVPPGPVMEPPTPPPGVPEIKPPAPMMPPVEPPVQPPPDRPFANPFAQATEAGGQPSRSFNENFDGDFNGVFYRQRLVTGNAFVPRVVVNPRTVVVPRAILTPRVAGFTPATTSTTMQTVQNNDGLQVITITNTNTTTNTPIIVNDPGVVNESVVVTDTVIANDRVAVQRIARLTLAARYSGVLITDNDNPRPQDRVYGGYNFYDDIGGALNAGLPRFDQQRQTVGFEKTFLGGDASFGMRLPFVQQYGGGVPGTHNVGDLSLLFKYALLNNVETGDILSAGFVLTTPTGSGDALLVDGSHAPHSTLFQPWLGFVQTFDRAYVQGITSFLVPSDGRDPTLFNNSLGFGYYLYRNADGFLTGVVPVGEVHVRTPLSNRNPAGLVFLQDQVNVNAGVHFRFNRATFSTSVSVPVVGPRPWNVEAIAFFNYFF